jgi:hypothetical protein
MKEQSEMHPQAATLPLQQPRIYSASLPLPEICCRPPRHSFFKRPVPPQEGFMYSGKERKKK